MKNNFESDNHFTVLVTALVPFGMAVQVNWIWVLGATATIPMVAVCEKFGSENVTSIVPLGAADTREQSIAEAVEEMSNVRHSESK
jgi:hypothetical protein